ncbi:GNAT family N-acetyltransferase [Streptomyces sp. ET3-23]|uniref:GNAT family N-acetyltransferase n=1 Tax=Streptomyces sp. ET3-23 TaxID=2885643 RepID=UPI001D0F504E|nr:GNAT family N-acetyltransferase [Streptomyces sp. ET3-23]MCC2280535.1 GNAT family N-acetyltransferase [Streptomyces sp. ET3-23]
MRPATAADIPTIETMILARSAWLEDRGLPSWRAHAAELAAQAENPNGDVWILADDSGKVIGCTTVQDETPPWGWTEDELAEPAHYLYTTVTDPEIRHHKPGTTIALWAVDRAFAEGRTWVRRGCRLPELVRYYRGQGFALQHEVQRTHTRIYLMARRAERIADLDERFKDLQRMRAEPDG